ncbi:hypothetical protein BDN72DRAFT_858109 [Pluteus cervinus]|uniref:Uncharacterized protein n=1 Tax=Pluteus cervinus TaxID=181527 RepID=A0ACD3ASF7_9AGAR|nr:hypothetical protein BDN72DRAFT_858109 [Pluteus cervinus]
MDLASFSFDEGEGVTLLRRTATGDVTVERFGYQGSLSDAQKRKILEILNDGSQGTGGFLILDIPRKNSGVAYDEHEEGGEGEDEEEEEEEEMEEEEEFYNKNFASGPADEQQVTDGDAAMLDEALSRQPHLVLPTASGSQGDSIFSIAAGPPSSQPQPHLPPAPPSTSPIVLPEGLSFRNPNDPDVVSTDFLTSYNLVYHTSLKLVICVVCQEGVPLTSIDKHIKSKKRQKLMLVDGTWESHLVPVEHRPCRGSVVKEVVKSLKEAGHIQDKSEIRGSSGAHEWAKSALPGPIADAPYALIPSLKVRSGYRCSYCRKIYATFGSIRAHILTHSDQRESAPCQPEQTRVEAIQTFCEGNSSTVHWFEVQPLPLPSCVPQPRARPSAQDIWLLEQENDMSLYADQFPNAPESVPPVFKELKIHDHFERASIDRTIIHTHFKASLSKCSQRDFQNLTAIVIHTYAENIASLQNTPSTTLACIVNSRQLLFRTTASYQPFCMITKPSCLAYGAFERNMIYRFIEYVRKPWSSGGEVFKFSDSQLAAIRALDAQISSPDFDKEGEAARMVLYEVLDSLYYPPQADRDFNNPFHSPIISYLACCFIAENGSFISVFLIPPSITKMQYNMRLRGVHKIKQLVAASADGLSPYRNIVVPFVVEFLQDWGDTPFSTIRQWTLCASNVARRTARPSTVQWQGEILTISSKDLSFPQYKEKLQAQHLEVEAFIEVHVLFGLTTIDALTKQFGLDKLKDNWANTSIGYGILFDSQAGGDWDEHSNPESKWFLSLMEQKNSLGMDVVEGIKRGADKALALAWLRRVEEAWVRLYPLAHILQGPPGRGAEEAALRVVNTLDAKRNAIFDRASGTGGFNCDYHKGASRSGLHKHILRLLPFRVWVLQWILVRIIRPIDRLLAYDHRSEDPADVPIPSPETRVYASSGKAWTPTKMSQVLSNFFRTTFGLELGLQLYRHLATAIIRKFFTHQMARTHGFLSSLVEPLGLQQEPSQGDMQTRLESCKAVSKMWHAIHDFPTQYQPLSPEQQRVKEEFSRTLRTNVMEHRGHKRKKERVKGRAQTSHSESEEEESEGGEGHDWDAYIPGGVELPQPKRMRMEVFVDVPPRHRRQENVDTFPSQEKRALAEQNSPGYDGSKNMGGGQMCTFRSTQTAILPSIPSPSPQLTEFARLKRPSVIARVGVDDAPTAPRGVFAKPPAASSSLSLHEPTMTIPPYLQQRLHVCRRIFVQEIQPPRLPAEGEGDPPRATPNRPLTFLVSLSGAGVFVVVAGVLIVVGLVPVLESSPSALIRLFLWLLINFPWFSNLSNTSFACPTPPRLDAFQDEMGRRRTTGRKPLQGLKKLGALKDDEDRVETTTTVKPASHQVTAVKNVFKFCQQSPIKRFITWRFNRGLFMDSGNDSPGWNLTRQCSLNVLLDSDAREQMRGESGGTQSRMQNGV